VSFNSAPREPTLRNCRVVFIVNKVAGCRERERERERERLRRILYVQNFYLIKKTLMLLCWGSFFVFVTSIS
jgi:hypothetical protein